MLSQIWDSVISEQVPHLHDASRTDRGKVCLHTLIFFNKKHFIKNPASAKPKTKNNLRTSRASFLRDEQNQTTFSGINPLCFCI